MATRRWSPSRGLRPRPASCEAAGVLPDSSHGVHLKDCPSIDNQHVSPLQVRYRPRRARCPAGWTCGPSGLRLLDHRGFVASLRPRNANPGLVPPLPFLTTSAACSSRAVQVCCTLQPIIGFAWLQATSRSWIHTVHPVHALLAENTSVLDSARRSSQLARRPWPEDHCASCRHPSTLRTEARRAMGGGPGCPPLLE